MLVDQISLAAEEPGRSDVRSLLQAALDHSNELYPPESCHGLDDTELTQSGANLQVARYKGEAIGCAALIVSDDQSGELKSFWVKPEFRGQGVATALLQKLRNLALEEGLSVLRLETASTIPMPLPFTKRPDFAISAPSAATRSIPSPSLWNCASANGR